MAAQDRDSGGRFGSKMRDQDILKAFDFEATADDPHLTVKEVTAALANHWGIEVTDEAVRQRLERMRNSDKVDKRSFGPSVAYRALVAPELSDEMKQKLDETPEFEEADSDELTSHEALKAELDIELE